MRIIRPKPDRELVNLTPLIDIVFNLLIFFMLTGSITAAEALSIDPASSTSRMRGNVEETVVLVDAEGRIALGERIVSRKELPGIIRETLTADPGALIQLKPDGEADAAQVIDIMEGIREGGAEYIVLLTMQRSARAVS
ncbi:MAG: biopolymer transporter ExbD [Novosphingobium sp.]|nr:biopolymer transporter ExbD [Novosphingobium sp.]MCP5401136.1 biopolymer transporter ExbD [Novosphingobium sp.]